MIMEKIKKIKESECDFDISKIRDVKRIDVTTEGIEITFELED